MRLVQRLRLVDFGNEKSESVKRERIRVQKNRPILIPRLGLMSFASAALMRADDDVCDDVAGGS